jgi:hypothetical protein
VEVTWCELRSGSDRILAGCFYRKPGASVSVSRELCRIIREAKNAVEIKKYTALMIAGDFNFPRVHWIEGSGCFGNENMRLSKNIFIETLDDCALNQCVTDPTLCEGNILDLLLTCSPERIFCIQHEAPLGDLENAHDVLS